MDCIFSSLKPVSTAFVGAGIQARTKVPWIAEYRDPWSMSPYMHANRLAPIRYVESRVERQLMRRSVHLVCVTEYWSARLAAFHHKDVTCIPHGFDNFDYHSHVTQDSCFTLVYTGVIYPDKRNPRPLFEAIAELHRAGAIQEGDIRVAFYGPNLREALEGLAAASNVREFIEIHSEVSFSESLLRQQQATALLLLSWEDARDAGTLTSKVFAYLGAKRPILALAYEGGELARLVRDTGCGVVANTPAQIKAVLSTWLHENRESGRLSSWFNPVEAILKRYERQTQAETLARLLDKYGK